MKRRIGTFFLTFFAPLVVQAANPTIQDIKLVNPLGENATLIGILDNIFGKALTIVFIIVPMIVVVGAFQMMLAAGNPEKFAKGQKTIMYAVIGLVVVACARGIVAIVKSLLTV